MEKRNLKIYNRKRTFQCYLSNQSCSQKQALGLHITEVHKGKKQFNSD